MEGRRMSELERIKKEVETLFNAGFQNKAEQKRVISLLGQAYDIIKQAFYDKLIEAEMTESDLYWDVPVYLHQNTTKKLKLYSEYPVAEQFLNELTELVEIRSAVLSAEINPVVKNDTLETEITHHIYSELEKREDGYLRGFDISKLLGGLNVYCNSHYGTTQNGTVFLRTFFYLHGKLTALNTIIAVVQNLSNNVK